MRTKAATVAVSLLLASACAEPTTDPTLPKARPTPTTAAGPQPSRSGRSNGAAHTYTIRVKKNGRLQRFRVRVDKQTRTLDIASSGISDPAECDPEFYGTCTGNGTQVDEEADGRIIVGNIGFSPDLPVAECPNAVDGGWWVRWRTHNFIIWGHWERIKSLRSWPFGKAEYLIPPGPWESDDNKARIWSGVVLSSCFGGYDRFGEWEGVIATFWLRGEAEEAGTNDAGTWAGYTPPDNGEGATTVDTSTGETNSTGTTWYTGDPEVDEVLKAFYEDGSCTPGWVIFVDGAQVC